MGHLKGRVATTILSAAIIDDVIGIVLLTVVIGFKSPDVQPASVCINIVLFFVLAFVLGFALYFLFKWLDKLWPHSALRVHIVRKNFSELQTSQAHMLQVLSSVTSRIHSTSKERWMSART